MINDGDICLHLSDKEVCCTKTDSVAASTRLFAELTPLLNSNNIAVKGEALNNLIAGIKATVSNEAKKQKLRIDFVRSTASEMEQRDITIGQFPDHSCGTGIGT